ncbi:peroxidase, partial [Salmonella enterica]|nr:peroxidase [Salmonella enterica]
MAFSFSGGIMSQVQSGILPEHCRAAIWIEANVKGDL